MLPLEEARDRILAAIQPLPVQEIALAEGANRVLAADITASINLPRFDNSAVDGYAVRSDDLQRASEAKPVLLPVVAEIPAGEPFSGTIGAQTCARIFTGSPLPSGADAVVMQEDVQPASDGVLFREPARPWENVRLGGEDVKAGSRVLEAGERLTVGAIALAGALGIAKLRVHRRPVVALLATGSELREPGEKLLPGQIYESNRTALAGLIRGAGGEPRWFPLVPDNLEATRTALHQAFEQCDLVITSGGVSVGELDFVKEAFQALGGEMDYWRVAIRPGKPFVFGRLATKHFFGLPGNPVSALVTALLLACPAILRAQGARHVDPFSHPAIAAEQFRNPTDRRHFMRVRVDDAGHAHLSGLQASHALGSLAACNGLVDVAPGSIIERGAQVRVIRFGQVNG
jgi:molybdopterin molybdotransferase